MRKNGKKLLSLMISAFLVLSMIPQIAIAAQEDVVTSEETTAAEKVQKEELVQANQQNVLEKQGTSKEIKDQDWQESQAEQQNRLKKSTLRGEADFSEYTNEEGLVFSRNGNDTVDLVDYTGTGKDVNIPESIVYPGNGKTYAVTGIRQGHGYGTIENLVIPDSVTSIVNSAFHDCSNLKTVKVGNSVKELVYAFSGCKNLTSVELPDSIEKLAGAFDKCSSLTQLNLPEGLKELGGLSGTAIKEITIPDSVETIFSYCFTDCTELKAVHLNSKITELRNATFLGCDNLEEITGGENVTKIGDKCFGGYDYGTNTWKYNKKIKNLGDIDLSKVTNIGEYAFIYMESFNNKNGVLDLKSIKTLGEYAFFDNQRIKELKLGDGLTKIPTAAFSLCYYMENIEIPNSVKIIGDNAFRKTDAKTITIGSDNSSALTQIGKGAFEDYSEGSTITINTAKSDVKLQPTSFGNKDNVIWTVESEDETGKVIFLNGTGGNDSNDGRTKEKAVKTFEKAKEIAKNNPEITKIYVTGTVEAKGELSLEGTNAILKRDESFDGYMLKVNASDTLTFTDITIDGNRKKVDASGSLIYLNGGTLNMEKGAVLKNNGLIKGSSYNVRGGAVRAMNGAVINMKDGTIENNQAYYGGGIYLEGSTLNMSGGNIAANKAEKPDKIYSEDSKGLAAGGAICAYEESGSRGKDSVINLNGGTIEKNKSENLGGGISLGTYYVSYGHNILNMNGGIIDGNIAGSAGGGIYVQAGFKDSSSGGAPSWSIANVNAGNITNNTMAGFGLGNKKFGGGGIYVNGNSSTYKAFENGLLNLKNAIISDNDATEEGGGYAACPVTKTNIYLKNGVAIYRNTGSSAKDLYILASNGEGPAHSGDPEYVISNTMLGGIPYHWKYDNGSEVPLDRLEGKMNGFMYQELKLHTDEIGNADTENLAKVRITGNKSVTKGGGIGSNGSVNFGEEDLTSINVSKTWVSFEDEKFLEV